MKLEKRNTKVFLRIDGNMYDVTNWLEYHPGGSQILITFSGKDCSDEFYAFHSPEVRHKLNSFKVEGMKYTQSLESVDIDFRNLRESLWKNGAFDTDKHWFTLALARCSVFFYASISLMLAKNPFIIKFFGAIFLGIFWQQTLLIAHDVCHGSAFKMNRWHRRLLGSFFGGVLGGVGAFWWSRDHALHHALSNVIGEDPSAGAEPFIFIDSKQYSRVPRHILARTMVRIQSVVYFPLCILFARPNLFIISSLISSPTPVIDCTSLAIFSYWVYNAFSMIECTPSEKMILFIVSNISTSILHLQLNLNHYPKPMFDLKESMKKSFFSLQVETTLNIISSPAWNWFHGGLEYQIEHHLFPLLPRSRLKMVAPLVQKICHDHGVKYDQRYFFDANLDCQQILYDVSKKIAILRI